MGQFRQNEEHYKEWLLMIKKTSSLGITCEQIKTILQSKRKFDTEKEVRELHD